MRLVSPLFPTSIEMTENMVYSVVIENRGLYLKVLKTLYAQCQGEIGDILLSENNETLKISNYIEMITDFVGFEPDNKKLQSRIQKMLEEEILSGENYHRAMELLADIEKFMDDASDRFSFSLDFGGISVNALIKMASPKWIDDCEKEIEHILNYMELVRELLGEKLFVFVGMKDYYSDQDMQEFIYSVVLHKYRVLLMESRESVVLDKEQRLLFDNDICVI